MWERTVQALELEGVQVGGRVEGKPNAEDAIMTKEKQKENIPAKPSVSFQDLFSKES